jgi:hypothetical protein
MTAVIWLTFFIGEKFKYIKEMRFLTIKISLELTK